MEDSKPLNRLQFHIVVQKDVETKIARIKKSTNFQLLLIRTLPVFPIGNKWVEGNKLPNEDKEKL